MIAVYQPKEDAADHVPSLRNTALSSSWPLCSMCPPVCISFPCSPFPMLSCPLRTSCLSVTCVLTANSSQIQTPRSSGSLHLCPAPQIYTSSPDWSLSPLPQTDADTSPPECPQPCAHPTSSPRSLCPEHPPHIPAPLPELHAPSPRRVVLTRGRFAPQGALGNVSHLRAAATAWSR